jgi:tripartite-type tricarboxylate transporter receptor subunit TctC
MLPAANRDTLTCIKRHKTNQREASVSALARTLVAACLAAPLASFAQGFPTKPVHLVVPYEPGGTVDITARSVAPRMSEALGQPVIIENRGGATGQIGAQEVARSAPDGYTIMFTVGGSHLLSQFTSKNLPYHPVRDFTPISARIG